MVNKAKVILPVTLFLGGMLIFSAFYTPLGTRFGFTEILQTTGLAASIAILDKEGEKVAENLLPFHSVTFQGQNVTDGVISLALAGSFDFHGPIQTWRLDGELDVVTSEGHRIRSYDLRASGTGAPPDKFPILLERDYPSRGSPTEVDTLPMLELRKIWGSNSGDKIVRVYLRYASLQTTFIDGSPPALSVPGNTLLAEMAFQYNANFGVGGFEIDNYAALFTSTFSNVFADIGVSNDFAPPKIVVLICSTAAASSCVPADKQALVGYSVASKNMTPQLRSLDKEGAAEDTEDFIEIGDTGRVLNVREIIIVPLAAGRLLDYLNFISINENYYNEDATTVKSTAFKPDKEAEFRSKAKELNVNQGWQIFSGREIVYSFRSDGSLIGVVG